MKNSFLLIIALMGCLLFSINPAIAQPNEPHKAQTSGKLPDNEGIVVSHLDAAGYTYMELENGGNKFWIAAPTTTVNKGDHIRFVENMVMTNFTSKTLNRTFSTLIFVTSTETRK